MKYRIMAAWRVLRGEWDAHPKPPTLTVYVDQDFARWNSGVITTASNARITYRNLGSGPSRY